jgi:hypothetical protein
MGYFRLDRDSDKDSTIVIFVNTDPPEEQEVSLPLSSVFNIESVDIGYSYSVIFTEKHNLGLGLGIALQNLEFGFEPSPNCDNPNCDRVEPRSAKATAPLPTFKIVYQYAINDKWIVDTDIGYLALELELDADSNEDLEGRIWNVSAGIRWKTWDHVGFQVSYKYFDVDVDYQKRSLVAEADYDYRGFLLGIDAYF